MTDLKIRRLELQHEQGFESSVIQILAMNLALQHHYYDRFTQCYLNTQDNIRHKDVEDITNAREVKIAHFTTQQ